MQITVTNFKDFTRWDVKSYLWVFKSNYPVEELGKYIFEHSEKEKIGNQPDTEFPILGVTNKVGVYLNEYVLGKDINQSYKKVRSGELTYNPYRVNVGSIGIVPDEFDNFYISPAYVVFGVNEGLLNEYIYLVLSSKWFNPYLRAATSGSVRQNLTFDLLCELKVPIPPIVVQEKIITDWRKTLQESAKLKKQAKEKKDKINEFVLQELGIEKSKYQKTENSFVVSFKDFERWGLDFNDYVRQGILNFESKYEVKPLYDVISTMQYGTSSKANETTGIPVLRMNNIVDGALDITDLKFIELSEKEYKSLRLDKGDLIFNRTNSKELVGKTAVFEQEGDYVFASYLIRVKLDDKKADSSYVNILFGTPIIRNQIDAISRQIIGQANINTEELKSFKIPLPPIDVQRELTKLVKDKQKTIALLLDESEQLLQEARNSVKKTLV